ncbi:DUF1996 domain-containing protein [Streptomyces triticisoli]|uniref:DUF1996 domain-containing protein n=1 Tax=Streptomyces triticisoli TaxID=2182797 RepID=UPI000DD53EA2|nr:DUF1996 domain-containing protein [Streptomyces triticisoli]
MGRNTRKRRMPLATKVIAGAAALALGGGGLVWANYYASAHESKNNAWGSQTKAASAQVATISCPDIGQKLTDVPQQARGEVDGELATLDRQITDAYQRLATTRDAQVRDASFVQNSILGPLKDRRKVIIDRIKLEINRAGGRAPGDLDNLANCTGTPADQTNAGGDQNGQDGQDGQQGQDGQNGQDGQDGQDGQNNDGQQGDDNGGQDNGGQQGIGGQAGNGPVAADFVDITTVQPNVPPKPRKNRNASTGTFTTVCGVNANGNHNTDNVIVAPGVKNGAHHLHDYVGNQKIDAFASNDTFLQGGTSCQNKNDLSSYYWPVVRVQDGSQAFDQDADGGGKEGNVGRILKPLQAQIKYVGSPTGKVVAMPQFLRIITGDAKTTTNGLANANAHWSCTGFENKVQLTEQYPICPEGSRMVRTFAFQSCWDGQNIDSANHRTHVDFADANGNCKNGFKRIPQLTMRLVYDVPRPTIENGVVTNAYAVDGFPEQLHKAHTDHDDFINITKNGLANKIANCINSGRNCR